MNKKLISILLALVMVFTLVACSGGGEEPKDANGQKTEEKADGAGSADKASGDAEFLSIATGGVAGTYYPLGGAIANILNDSDLGLQVTAQSTGASIENVQLISRGDAEIAFVQNDVTYYAYNGIEAFEEKGAVDTIAGMATLYPEVVQIIARADAGINSIEDIKGKKVAVGDSGSGTELNARQILEIHGITYDDLDKVDYLSFKEAADQIKNKQIDVAFVTAAVPTSAVTEVSTTADVKLISLDVAKIKELSKQYPYYIQFDIDADNYKGQDNTVHAAAVMAMLIVPKNMSEELVYNMTKAIFENTDVIIEAHARGNDITLETALNGMPIEVHPGAQKYFDENNVKAD
ncbi:MAG: TAXI family TRAP transporter solute-binding subunit [Tissierellia bacterium]|nr:TAXI family TRAP transporter solute-binding subunit [Tissierellia bacterium]